MEAKNNAKLLETSGSEISRCQRDLVFSQVLHDRLDSLNILRKLGVVCLISLDDLLYLRVSVLLSSFSRMENLP